MQEQIDKIEIGLENCELITIDGEHIGELNIEDIKYSINRIACNAILELYTCSHFSMSIHRDANKGEKTVSTVGVLDELRQPLNRLNKYPDITSLYVYFAGNDTPKQIRLMWTTGDECNNPNQKTVFNRFGDLYIVVDEKLTIDDVFGNDTINEEDHVRFVWEMYE